MDRPHLMTIERVGKTASSHGFVHAAREGCRDVNCGIASRGSSSMAASHPKRGPLPSCDRCVARHLGLHSLCIYDNPFTLWDRAEKVQGSADDRGDNLARTEAECGCRSNSSLSACFTGLRAGCAPALPSATQRVRLSLLENLVCCAWCRLRVVLLLCVGWTRSSCFV